MLNSFEIRNFRLFQHLEVKRLGRVNLIVGKNNSGKSSFLEAIKLYASNASPNVFVELVESRQETWISEAQPSYQKFFNNPVRHLFFGHKLPRIGEEGIILGEIDSNTKLHINTAAYQDQYNEFGISNQILITNFNPDQKRTDVSFFMVAEENGETRVLFRLYKDMKDWQRSGILIDVQNKYVWQTVFTINMSEQKLADLWDLTSLNTDFKTDIISALGLIDQRVSGVSFIRDISKGYVNNTRIPLVKLDGIDEPLPLKNMGDGMTRLLHIIVALVNAQNGILLIDEFENGLHWSIQPKVWDIIFQLSEKLNVQIFATTHSRDCVESFARIWNNYPKLGAFFRLEAKDELIKVTEYTSETLTDAIDMEVEMR